MLINANSLEVEVCRSKTQDFIVFSNNFNPDVAVTGIIFTILRTIFRILDFIFLTKY